MARIAERSGLSPAEYLAWEREQPVKHEYFLGEVFAMAGGSLRHNALSANTIVALHAALRTKGSQVFTSDQRTGVGSGERYVYPDVTVVCGPVLHEPSARDVVTNPSVIVEVLSPSTEPYDRGLKWEGYQRLPSLTDYVLVSQSEARLEHFLRQPNGAWLYRAAGAGEQLTLANGAVLDVDQIFAGVFELSGE